VAGAGSASAARPAAAAAPAKAALTREQERQQTIAGLHAMSEEQLRGVLRDHGFSSDGCRTKQQLVDRIAATCL
jgi:hypothetical protein